MMTGCGGECKAGSLADAKSRVEGIHFVVGIIMSRREDITGSNLFLQGSLHELELNVQAFWITTIDYSWLQLFRWRQLQEYLWRRAAVKFCALSVKACVLKNEIRWVTNKFSRELCVYNIITFGIISTDIARYITKDCCDVHYLPFATHLHILIHSIRIVDFIFKVQNSHVGSIILISPSACEEKKSVLLIYAGNFWLAILHICQRMCCICNNIYCALRDTKHRYQNIKFTKGKLRSHSTS